MVNLYRFSFTFIINLIICASLVAQDIKIHSHNDYYQTVPFYQAYAQKVYSIEVDVFYENGKLLVGHDREEIKRGETIEDLYINPIAIVFDRNGGRIWRDSDDDLILLVDLKTEYEPVLDVLVGILDKYPEIFNSEAVGGRVKLVISGNMPQPDKFISYPSYIYFDGRLNTNYTEDQLKRLGMVSAPFKDYSRWNGKGAMIAEDKTKVEKAISEAKELNVPFRFWGSPDGVTAWSTLHKMEVDIINTDRVEACADYFNNYSEKSYTISETEKR